MAIAVGTCSVKNVCCPARVASCDSIPFHSVGGQMVGALRSHAVLSHPAPLTLTSAKPCRFQLIYCGNCSSEMRLGPKPARFPSGNRVDGMTVGASAAPKWDAAQEIMKFARQLHGALAPRSSLLVAGPYCFGVAASRRRLLVARVCRLGHFRRSAAVQGTPAICLRRRRAAGKLQAAGPEPSIQRILCSQKLANLEALSPIGSASRD
jgi:hypothetical protein